MSKSATKRSRPPASASAPATPIPTPFTKAPAALQPFLDLLDPSQVYLTHIDRFPAQAKRKIFLIPVLLNLAIALLLLWRLKAAVPTYWALFQTFLGYPSSATVDTETTTRQEQMRVVLARTAMFAFDFVAVRFVGPWPLTFFLEQPANPVTWRWKLGFRDAEIVVRASRNWGAEDLMKGVRQGEENAFFKTRILPAIERERVRGKTGYLLMDGSWDLDFQLMLDAHTLVERKELGIKDLDRFVLVCQEGVGWIAWQWETDRDVLEERRQKVVKFKEALTKMGKESLFFRWMEIVEEERDKDGGFTVQGQEKVAARVKREFEKAGVDFDELTRNIGGLEELRAGSGSGGT